ncbi:TPA: phosphoethanolamine transferase [Klebsiella pneumoniae]|nr:phosphoethanolamine transferase [Klebsiella pneumoniae]
MKFKIIDCIKRGFGFYKWDVILISWISLVHFSLGYGVKVIYVLSVFFGLKLLFCFSKFFYISIILILSLIGFIYSPVGVIYGYPDINVVGSFLYTDSSESKEFLIGTPFYIYLTSFLIVLIGFFLLKMPFSKKISSSRVKVFFFVFFVISSTWSAIRQGGILNGDIALPEIRFVKDLYSAYKKVEGDRVSYSLIIKSKSIWSPNKSRGEYKNYILVIGESARRDYVHSFGGKYSNTPWLDSAPAMIFDNYISAGPSTMISLTNTLSLRKGSVLELNNNVVTLASKAGFETWWLSNQGSKGHFDSPISLIGHSADYSEFIKSGSSDDRLISPDENLLPLLDVALNKNKNENKLIVLHLMGSHPKACIRTNNTYDIDVGAKEVSCYIKSIEMTDQFLSKVISLANQTGESWSVMYFSDHGLSYVNKDTQGAYLTHGDKTKENYEVPFFIINSNSEIKEVVHQPRSALDFMTTFSQWLKISDRNIPSACNMLSNENCSNEGYVIDFNGNYIKFNDLPSVP